jgi:hypothetical protein
MTNTTYSHHKAGTIEALPYTSAVPLKTQADWVAVKAGGLVIGFVLDTRADEIGKPSAEMPADDDARPFDSFDRNGRYITCTHSLRGALLAIGNRT